MSVRFEVDSMHARNRLLRQPATVVSITMQKGTDETQSVSITVPDEALNSSTFGLSVEDLVKEALEVRLIQVWVECYVNEVKTIETLFVPVFAWHTLSTNWMLTIEDYVQAKLFDSPENQAAQVEKKRSGSYTIIYRRNGAPGEITRKERFHDWLVGLTGRGQTIFFRRWHHDWPTPPMPSVNWPSSKVATA